MVALGILVPSVSVRIAAVQRISRQALLRLAFFFLSLPPRPLPAGPWSRPFPPLKHTYPLQNRLSCCLLCFNAPPGTPLKHIPPVRMASVASYCALTTRIDTEWMVNNSLSISNIQKILGANGAEDFT